MLADIRTAEPWTTTGALIALAVACLVVAFVVVLVTRRR
jgi:hypothetical protein